MGYKHTFIVALLSIVIVSDRAFPYDNEIVHPMINAQATLQSSIDSYIKNQLVMPKGIYEKVSNKIKKDIKEWLSYGGKTEDYSIRPLNHFHDPLKEWGDAGMTASHSSLVWAQHQDPVSDP